MYTFLYMKWLSIGNLTIVSFIIVAFMVPVSRGQAAPHQPEPNLEDQPSSTTPPVQNTDALKYMDISNPPPMTEKVKVTQEEKTYFYPYSMSMGPRLGFVFYEETSLENPPLILLGFFHMLHSISSNHIEVGGDLHSNSTGALNVAMQHFYFPSEKFRPFVKGGTSLLIEPEKGLANFVDYHNYRLRLGAGIEDMLKDPASLRWDIEATLGLTSYSLNIVFGYAWAW